MKQSVRNDRTEGGKWHEGIGGLGERGGEGVVREGGRGGYQRGDRYHTGPGLEWHTSIHKPSLSGSGMYAGFGLMSVPQERED